jgi:hypothetical protein
MTKSKHTHSGPTRRGRAHGGGKKGRAANPQTRRGLLATDDTSTLPESVVPDAFHALGSRSGSGEGKDEDDEEQNSPEPSGTLHFLLCALF